MINQQQKTYSRLSILMPQIDLLHFLEKQKVWPKFYWKGDQEYAALGALAVFNAPPIIEGDLVGHVRCFGGARFTKEKNQDALWKDFPNAYFFLPLYELKQEGAITELTLHFLDTSASDEGLRHLNFTQTKEPYSSPSWQKREDLPLFSDWEKILTKALKDSSFKKVVLARRSSFDFAASLQPFSLLAERASTSNAKVIYGFEPNHNAAFIGATPERLYVREGKKITSDIVAGTFTCENQLLGNEAYKLQKEFLFVKEALATTFQSLCTSCVERENTTIKAHNIHHLYSQISGTLRPEITDAQLIEAIHPTPAIGGYPEEAASTFIHNNEPFDRGWYSAPIGWVSEPAAEFAVAIRSALIQENKMHLFAGAGIVEGSESNREWEELELKIRQYL
jgi:menaquinone-specific isochorismate synthase